MTVGPSAPDSVVRVRRTGGFLGRAVEGVVDLESGDERVGEVRALLDELSDTVSTPARLHPDMYSYEFDLAGHHISCPEHLLSADLRRLAELLLDR